MQSEFSLGEERRCEQRGQSFELYARIAVNLVNCALVEDRRCVRSHDESHTASGDSRKTAHHAREAAAMSFSASARPWAVLAAPAARCRFAPCPSFETFLPCSCLWPKKEAYRTQILRNPCATKRPGRVWGRSALPNAGPGGCCAPRGRKPSGGGGAFPQQERNERASERAHSTTTST